MLTSFSCEACMLLLPSHSTEVLMVNILMPASISSSTCSGLLTNELCFMGDTNSTLASYSFIFSMMCLSYLNTFTPMSILPGMSSASLKKPFSLYLGRSPEVMARAIFRPPFFTP